MKNKKFRLFSVIVALLTVAVMLLSACGNDSGKSDVKDDSTSTQQSNSASESASGSQSVSNSVSGSQSGTSTGGTSQSISVSVDDSSLVPDDNPKSSSSSSDDREPTESAKTTYAKLYEMTKLASLDGSYLGTDTEVGFSNAVARKNNTFLNYPVGYGEGTTGGRGASQGNIYDCKTGLEFIDALNSISAKQKLYPNLKAIIKVSGTITQKNSSAEGTLDNALTFQIIVNSINNLSVVGDGLNGIFDGVGLNFKSCNNVIVQNLTIHHPSRILHNEKDCLEFNKCNYVWVDHNELYNDTPKNSSEKDYYDGLCDVKNESSHVTISYNNFHDAFKTSLVGSGPEDLCETRKLTYHHNIFKNCNSRVPLIRSGKAHVYNNYYESVGTGINVRFACEAFVESNVFVSVKNPICSIEETKGFWNAKNNVYQNCSGSGLNNESSGSTFTPSYEYVLDSTDGLKAYLDSTVGVGKIDLATSIGATESYQKYTIPSEKLISRAISELPTISFNNDSLQRLVYLSKSVIVENDATIAKIQNLNTLISAVEKYFELFASDVDTRINAIDKTQKFDVCATAFYAVKADFDRANQYILSSVKKTSELNELKTYFENNFVALFNAEVASLVNATSQDMPSIERLKALYELSSQKDSLSKTALDNAYSLSNDHIKAEAFSTLVTNLPSASQIKITDSAKVSEAKQAFESLTSAQLSFVSSAISQKYNDVMTAFNLIANSSKKLDLSSISLGRTTAVTQVGDFKVGASTDIKAANVTNGGTNYTKAVYISGYGNTGSKCILFTAFVKSNVTLVLNSETGAAKLKLTDMQKNLIDSYTTDNNGLVTVTFTNVEAGDYCLFTDIPDGTIVNDSKLYVYEATITPVE